ncbi:MAG: hypothetical protein HY049_20155 [Acidobacteria bacterium]|nr:hypothetical protein [Acidobacteriota bacterium]
MPHLRRGRRDLIRRLLASFAILSLLLACAAPAVRAEDGKVTSGIKSFGKKVGEKSVEAGHAIAGIAKKIWYKGKQVSAPLLHDVQRSTRKFWDETIKGKDKSIDALKDENGKLKGQLDGKGD